jgi:N5-(cytidine 5'-diphosphoramidyl)-L-glutamine hydrolase
VGSRRLVIRPRVGLTQRVEDLPDRAERRDALDQQWAVLLEQVGLTPVPVPNLLLDPGEFVDSMDLALIVLTGGNDLACLPGGSNPAPERDATEARILDHAIAVGLPVLGVCRGMQMMIAHAGGTLTRVGGHVRAPHTIELLDDARWPIRDGRIVNSFHDWGVERDSLGSFVALAVAPDDTVEAACHPELPQVCVMWHPERSPEDSVDLDLINALLERETHASNRSRRG